MFTAEEKLRSTQYKLDTLADDYKKLQHKNKLLTLALNTANEDEEYYTWNRERWTNSGVFLYKADAEFLSSADDLKWRPSIHMPRDAARLFLKVKSVRVERLQDITEDSYGM